MKNNQGAKSDEDFRSQQTKEAEEIINDDVIQEEQTTANEERTTPNGNEDDIEFEDVNEEGEVTAKDTIKKLREKIKKLEGEKQEYLDLSQRTRADYVNFKKEVESNQASNRKFATKRFIEELLPVLDSYDMAQGNKEAWEKVDQNWRIGIEYIFNQFKTVLENEGVTQFGKVGDIFDPNLHESMEMVTITDEKENGKIVNILQSGYRMNETILRPARVKVGNFEKEN